MIRALSHLRDFLTEEDLKWLPGNLRSDVFITLKKQIKQGPENLFGTKLLVFDKTGTYIGEIISPDFIPE